MKCINCGEKIDEFVGKETGAKAWLHVIKVDTHDTDGYLLGWTEESNSFCRNPEPTSDNSRFKKDGDP